MIITVIFVNGIGVRFDGVNDESIIKSHVCELSIDFFTIKKTLLCFSDYVNNTHSFKNIHTIPKSTRKKVEITWNANTLRWLLLTFDDLFFHETFYAYRY